MDKVPDLGSGDCRLESCHGRGVCDFILILLLISVGTMTDDMCLRDRKR